MILREMQPGLSLAGLEPNVVVTVAAAVPIGDGALQVAHLTYRAVCERRQNQDRPNPRTWNNANLVARARMLFVVFLDHLDTTFFASDPEQKKIMRSARSVINSPLANILTIARQELDFTV